MRQVEYEQIHSLWTLWSKWRQTIHSFNIGKRCTFSSIKLYYKHIRIWIYNDCEMWCINTNLHQTVSSGVHNCITIKCSIVNGSRALYGVIVPMQYLNIGATKPLTYAVDSIYTFTFIVSLSFSLLLKNTQTYTMKKLKQCQ